MATPAKCHVDLATEASLRRQGLARSQSCLQASLLRGVWDTMWLSWRRDGERRAFKGTGNQAWLWLSSGDRSSLAAGAGCP